MKKNQQLFELRVHNIESFTHTISGVIVMNKKQQENQEQQRNQNKFNSGTERTKPTNQNQTHNVKSEGVEPKIRQV